MCKLSPESLWPKVLYKSDVLSPDLPASGALQRHAQGWGRGRQRSWQPGPRDGCTEMGRFFSKHSSKPCKEVPRGGLKPRRGLLCWKEIQDWKRAS